MTFRDHHRARCQVPGSNLGRQGAQPCEAHSLARASWQAARKDCPVTTNRPARQSRPRPTRSRQRVRPLPRGNTLYTPSASPARQAAERRSARPLIYLYQLPRWVAPLLLVVFLIAGLALRGPAGAVALCVVAAVLAWLAALSWPQLNAGGRLGRVLAVALMLALAGYQASR